ncbi:glycosyltransferase family 1 protein [Nguyenibacter vanlangensis]|uniref:Glycosyltransferase family 1 protein n=1 Tax=Nguyenibacter vanlangensis TaxID=1216886 RepID=A0ABZ3D807_9PROT
MVSTPIRVGIDGFNLALPRGTGVATYARTLSRCLTGMGHKVDVLYGMNITHRMSTDLREVIFFDSLGQEVPTRRTKLFSSRWWRERRGDLAGYDAVPIPLSGRVDARGFTARMPAHDRLLNVPELFHRAALHYRYARRFTTVRIPDPPAIMHWTYPLPIRVTGALNIYTMHDLVPLRLPHTTLDNKSYYFRLIKDLCIQADGICTVSEASKSDIIDFFPQAAPKIHNTYQSIAPGHEILEKAETEIAREIHGAFGLEMDSYFLFFGSFEPKKNIGRVIEGFLESKSSRRLVLVGAMAWKSEQELRFLERGIQLGRIVKIDYLPESLLGALIRGARAVLFPSLSEGFGLPVLEAMAFGTAVLTSREGAPREVAGEDALLVDPYDTAAITDGIDRLDRNDALCTRLAAAGPSRAALYDMDHYARRLGTMYDTVLKAAKR